MKIGLTEARIQVSRQSYRHISCARQTGECKYSFFAVASRPKFAFANAITSLPRHLFASSDRRYHA
jgi:hypothetical protein